MSTRSLIAIKNTDGTVSSIYCHWDGYPSNNGRLILEHYAEPGIINALLALGSLSSLQKRLAPEPGTSHSYNCPQTDVTVAYHRDRGEPYQPPRVWPNETEMLAKASDEYWVDYCYLFRDGTWFVAGTIEPFAWRNLEEVLNDKENTR